MTIDELIKYITENYVFDEKTFPSLKDATEKEKLTFALNHSALHFAKTAGKIAAVPEDVDHGMEVNEKDLRENIPKALINTLRLAELIGMTEADIIKAIREKYENNK